MLPLRRWPRAMPFAIAVVILCVAVAAYIVWEPAFEPIRPPAPSSIDRELAIRGARVVALGDCVVCHTSPGGKPYAGGLPLATPFGTLYSTNITPDETTGIGNWSLAAFSRALRKGIGRDGMQLYPAFPYVHYTKMSDDDIAAAYAFLMRREAVVSRPPENQLVFPLNFRPLVAFWNVLFLTPGPEKPDPARSSEWNRGRELVTGLGHCAACHSPLNPIGAESWGRSLRGGVVDQWEAPSLIGLASAAVPWTEDDLATYLRSGLSEKHGAAAGPMLPVVQELATVPPSDVRAIAAYIWSLQEAPSRSSAAESVARDPQAERRGAVLFTGSCAACHGDGAPMQAVGLRPSLSTSSAVHADTPRNLIQMIRAGIPWQGETPTRYMPAFAGVFDDGQIADIAAYLRAAYSVQPPWAELPRAAAEISKGDVPR